MSDAARILTGRLHKAMGVGYGEPVALSQDETRALIALLKAASVSKRDLEAWKRFYAALSEADRRFREGTKPGGQA